MLATADGLPGGFTGEWSGTVGLRHREGRVFPMGLRVSALPGRDGEVDWLVSTTAPDAAVLESVGEACPFPMAVWDSDLRMTWLVLRVSPPVPLPAGHWPGAHRGRTVDHRRRPRRNCRRAGPHKPRGPVAHGEA